MRATAQTRAFLKHIRRYFVAYGGWKAVFLSPIFILAVLINIWNYHSWIDGSWADNAISIIPSLLGFSLGTYAILFSLITENLKFALKKTTSENGISYLEAVNSTFFHFIFVQVLSFFLAICKKSSVVSDVRQLIGEFPEGVEVAIYWIELLISFIGALIFYYSVLLILAAAQAVFRIALIVEPRR